MPEREEDALVINHLAVDKVQELGHDAGRLVLPRAPERLHSLEHVSKSFLAVSHQPLGRVPPVRQQLGALSGSSRATDS